MRITHLFVVTMIVLFPSPLFAGKMDKLLDQAAQLTKSGESEKAARIYGTVVYAAHKAGDLMLEQRATKALAPLFSGAAPKPAMAAAMKSLNPKRSGAFLSAHTLAICLLIEDAKVNQSTYTAPALAVLKKHAKAKGSGKCAQACLDFATGMQKLVKGDPKGADRALAKALAVTVQESWTDLSIYISTELCALRLAQNDPAAATKAIGHIATLFQPSTDPMLFEAWITAIRFRLPAASASVLAAHKDARAARTTPGGMIPGGDGADGAPGGSAGGHSKFGLAFPGLGNKSIVDLKLTNTGFNIKRGFDLTFNGNHAFADGVTYHADGGVTLAFFGNAVSLESLDLMMGAGGAAGMGGNFMSMQWRTYYRLARGEALSITKLGVRIR